jgi:dTDP-4-amino-4,6-dideoxygalactose transaminase
MRHPLPAVPAPLSAREVWDARGRAPEARQEFEAACREYHGSVGAFAVSSGRAALWLALKALSKRRPGRLRVILPAYTCPTVARAVLAAGLTGVCVDISSEGFSLDAALAAEQLDERVLAVVAAHMFGTPCDLPALRAICDQAGAALIEDAAQACGGRYGGRVVGSFGDLAILSLGRSKNLRGAGGGVLLVNREEWVEAVRSEVAQLPDAGPPGPGAVLRQVAVSALSRPRAWQLVKGVPCLHIGAEDQSFDHCPSRLSAWQSALGMLALERLDDYNERRGTVGTAMELALANWPIAHVQEKRPPRQSTYTRLALRLDVSREQRDRIAHGLQRRAIDARPFYTRALYRYDWWPGDAPQDTCPEAEGLVATNLVLPIYYDMTESEAAGVASALKTAAETARSEE